MCLSYALRLSSLSGGVRTERDGQLPNAWAVCKATGQHVTEGEADAWLSRLEAGADAEPPFPPRLTNDAR